MEGELFYDRIVCYIEPSIEELDAMCDIMNQTRSKYKIMVCSNNVYKYNYETRDRLEFVNIKSKGNIEYKAMKFCFDNYFSSSYFLIRNEDSLYNFKYLIAYSLKNKKEFVIVNEDKRYYDKLAKLDKSFSCFENPEDSSSFKSECEIAITYLRNRTRNNHLVQEENINYGLCKNLLNTTPVGIIISV